ncbi:putative ester cyclase [Oxalobacteraceae bacterium GrIS 2.11]
MATAWIIRKVLVIGASISACLATTFAWADADANKLLVAKAFEAFQAGDVNAINTIFLADGPSHSPDGKVSKQGGPFADLKNACSMCASLNDRSIKIDFMLAEGDLVAARSIWRGNYVGKLRGVQISGTPVTVVYFNIYRIMDGRIVENWACRDSLNLATQLGFALVPADSSNNSNAAADTSDKK